MERRYLVEVVEKIQGETKTFTHSATNRGRAFTRTCTEAERSLRNRAIKKVAINDPNGERVMTILCNMPHIR